MAAKTPKAAAAAKPPNPAEGEAAQQVTILAIDPRRTETLRGCYLVSGCGTAAADSPAADYARTHRGFAVVEPDGTVTRKT